MTKDTFLNRMIGRRLNLRRRRKNNGMTPGVKAADTKRLRTELQSKNLFVVAAITSGFSPAKVNALAPAEKAHLTRGTYDPYIAVS